eukprot:g4766.t1
MNVVSLSDRFSWNRYLISKASRTSFSRHSKPVQCTTLPLKANSQKFQITSEELKTLLSNDGVVNKPQKTLDCLAAELGTDLQNGLASDEQDLASRRVLFGANYLQPLPPVSFLEILKDALDDFTIIILIISGALSLTLEGTLSPTDEFGWLEGAAILASVAVVVTVSAITNYQKEIKFRELSSINEDSQVRVVRDGIEQEISCFELLVGDLVKIESGDILQSDGILIDGSTIRLDESHLTGESDEVCRSRTSDPFVFSGSKVNEGVGKMLVLAVGSNSKQGSIASLASGQGLSNNSQGTLLRQKTVLTEKLERLAGDIGRFGLGAALVTLGSMAGQFSFEIFIHNPQPWNWQFLEVYLHQLITSITILVVAVPEGLPLASTLALAFSVQRMMQDNNLVRHLEACETMGSITAICTDKTGTLTLNNLAVKQLWLADRKLNVQSLALTPEYKQLITEAIALNSTASLGRMSGAGIECIGNRMECGLLKFLMKDLEVDYRPIREAWRNLEVTPFTSSRKRMSSLVQKDNKTIFHLKGAPEIVLKLCKFQMMLSGERKTLSDSDRNKIINGMSGLRLLALAFKEADSELDTVNLESDLCLICVIGLSDSIRASVPSAIQQCQRAGVDVKMLTGDNAVTAASIAESCNILQTNGKPALSVLEGPEFRSRVLKANGELDTEEFLKIWGSFKVMARCTPEDKYLLVQGIKSIRNGGRREVIAMTGDGTNDAPALKIADVGFAMASGTPIARDASDILLLDDSFESIVSAMKWGRNVYSSVTKFLQFQLTVNVVAVVTACTGAVFLQESPLSAVQMLWVNLIMDSLASLSLATEPPNDDVLDLPPNLSDAPILSPVIIKNIIGQSLYQMIVMYILVFKGDLLFGNGGDRVHDFTLVFNAFVSMQLANQLNARKIYNEASILDGLFGNRLFLTIWCSEFVLQYLIVQFGGAAFQTSPLSGLEWFICIGFGALSLPMREILRR